MQVLYEFLKVKKKKFFFFFNMQCSRLSYTLVMPCGLFYLVNWSLGRLLLEFSGSLVKPG